MSSKIAKKYTIIIALCCMCAVVSCTKTVKYFKHTFFRMDTFVEVTIPLSDIKKQNAPDTAMVITYIDSILTEWEERFSANRVNSEVKKINQRLRDTVAISKDLSDMISVAKAYGDSLRGGFDLTILPLKVLWHLSEDSDDTSAYPQPDQLQIDSVLANVDYRKVSLSQSGDSLYFINRDIKIDVGGVAKGFILVRIANYLADNGFANYLVNGGGDIIGNGVRADGKAWVIGIQHPRKSDSLLTAFSLERRSVFTSGDYERFRIINGQRVHHLFNPHTGYSATTNQSVSIYGNDPLQNKFLSTGLFSTPADSIVAYIKKRPELSCMVVDSSGKVYKWGMK
ncbi:MAG: FAD:protein FMN transferase [Fibrobacter sp.]|nr:FAD:protein FMN transferase [Fibrobacter sp.]